MKAASPLISIVEDDDSLREALIGLVRSLGYRAAAYPTAEAFLDARGGAPPDCIVTDIQMPGLSGIDLKLRLEAEGVTTPVIMVTARAEPALHDRAMASGAHCLLRKPFPAEALIACLDSALTT